MGLDNYIGHKKITRLIIRVNSFLSKFSDVTLNNSKKSLEGHRQFGFKNQFFIPNGFQVDAFKPNHIKYVKFRNYNNLKENTKIIGAIARNHADKNIELFLKIANELLKEDVNLHFFIAGRGCSAIELKKYLDDDELISNFTIMESIQSEVYLPVLDLYLSTSKVEGFPNVLAEAMLCGVPIVASNVGDCKDIIVDYGEIFELTETTEKIRDRINRVLDISSDKKEQMREFIIDNYSIDAVTKQFEKHYD
jgi:glycosyltransferase